MRKENALVKKKSSRILKDLESSKGYLGPLLICNYN